MSGLRKSTRLRKPITTIDQNLDDDEDDAFITSKPKKSIQRVSNKRQSITDDNDEQELITSKPKKSTQRVSNKRPSTTDDNDEQELITPTKRQKKKPSTTTKTSPYFDKKKPVEPKPKKKTEKINISIDENKILLNNTTHEKSKGKFKIK